MKYLIILTLFLLTACGEERPSIFYQPMKVTVKTYRKGIRVYSEENQALGYSPVVIDLECKVIEDNSSKIKRYFIDGAEVDAGGTWPLRLKVFKQGFKELVTLRVPFQPGQWAQVVTVEKN